MNIELIPVLDIIPQSNEITPPTEHPFWQHSEIWDQYQRDALTHDGFSSRLEPYRKGFPFYALTSMHEEDIAKVVNDHISGFLEGEFPAEEIISLNGGYILKQDNVDQFFPQCYGELADIGYWKSLASGSKKYPCQGSPAPSIYFEDDLINFDFFEDPQGEMFSPPPATSLLQISRRNLDTAVKQAEIILNDFGLILKKINQQSNYGLENIDRVLIWGNAYK